MTYNEYLSKINEESKKNRLVHLVDWVKEEFPHLELVMKWNQPMFTDHNTFIIAFCYTNKHLSVSPEKMILDRYLDEVNKSGYTTTKMLFHIKWNQEIDYNLLELLIKDSMYEKSNYSKFWL